MIPLSTVPLMGGAPPARLYVQGASSRSAPRRPWRLHARSMPRFRYPHYMLVKKSSGYQHRSPERLAALAAAACRPGVLPGPLPNRELISEPASRLDAFSGYPFRA